MNGQARKQNLNPLRLHEQAAPSDTGDLNLERLQAELGLVQSQLARMRMELEATRFEQQRTVRQLEETVTYLAHSLGESRKVLSDRAAETENRLERYLNIAPLRLGRWVRRRIFGL